MVVKNTSMKRLRIWWLKQRYKWAYHAVIMHKGYNCGHMLSLEVDQDYYAKCLRFDKLAEKLQQLDPNCPKFKFIDPNG